MFMNTYMKIEVCLAWNLINCTQKLVKALCRANVKQERIFFLQDADRLCQIIKISLPVLITEFEKAKAVSREVV